MEVDTKGAFRSTTAVSLRSCSAVHAIIVTHLAEKVILCTADKLSNVAAVLTLKVNIGIAMLRAVDFTKSVLLSSARLAKQVFLG